MYDLPKFLADIEKPKKKIKIANLSMDVEFWIP